MLCGRSLPALLLLFLLLLPDAEVAEEEIIKQEVPPCPARCACSTPREVHCVFRSLKSFPAGVWRRVERVNLGYNAMTSLPAAALAGLSRLRLLLLHGNEIEEIQDGAMHNLGALQVLKLSYNRLRALRPGSLQGARSLMRLHLDHNRLASLDADSLLGLTSLRLLTLEGNALTSLPPGALATFDLLPPLPLTPAAGRGRGWSQGRGPSFLRVSTLRHLSLADNALTSLPPAMLPAALPLLETLALHGNPWACDCTHVAWVGAWTARVRAAMRCRKDRDAARGGTSCPACASPTHLRDHDLRDLGADVACVAPALRSLLPKNGTREPVAEVDDDDGDDIIALGVPGDDDIIGVDMSDMHGTRVALACNPTAAGPPRVTNVHALAVDPEAEGEGQLGFEVAVSLNVACAVTSGEGRAYERAWQLLAYYGEVSAALAAADDHVVPRSSGGGSNDVVTARHYAQDPDDAAADAAPYYYTGLRVNLTTPPMWAWLTTPRRICLRLDRKRTTRRRVVVTYEARFSRTLPLGDADDDADGDDVTPWVTIAPDPDAGGVIAREGDDVWLPCDVTTSAKASVAIAWRLPGGAVVTRMLAAAAPEDYVRARVRGSSDLKRKRGRGSRVSDVGKIAPGVEQRRDPWSPHDGVTVLVNGSLLLPAARTDDAGRYVCVAIVGGTAQDRAVRRLVVTSSRSGPLSNDDTVKLTATPGAALILPCAVSGATNAAAMAWELPGGRLLRRGENASSLGAITAAAVDGNGSLALTPLRGTNSGRFRCIAVNQAGSDAFAVEVAVVGAAGARGDDVTGGADAEEASGAGLVLRAAAADAGNGGRTGGNRTSLTRGRKLEAEKKQNRNSAPRRRKLLPLPLEVTWLPGPSPEQPPRKLVAVPDAGVVSEALDQVVTGTDDFTREGDVTASCDDVIRGTDVADGAMVTDRGCAKSSYDIIKCADVINMTYDVINATGDVIAPNATAANVSAPSAEDEGAETEEESVEAPPLTFPDLRNYVIPASPPGPALQFQPGSNSGSSAGGGDFWPFPASSASGSSEQRPPWGGEFRWGFPLPRTSDPDPPTLGLATTEWGTQAMPTSDVTTATLRDRRRGRKRVRNRGRQAPSPTSSHAQLQLPVPEAPPPDVSPRPKLSRESGRRHPTATPVSHSSEPEVVTTGGGLSTSSPVRHARLVMSLPAVNPTPGRVTGAFADVTVFSLNTTTETAIYDVIGVMEDGVTAQTAVDYITAFAGIPTDDVTTPTDDVTDTAAKFKTDDVVRALLTPDPMADLTPRTPAAFPGETAGDVTASTLDDVIGDVIAVRSSSNVIARSARPLPDALSASGSAEAPPRPPGALPVLAPPPAPEAETSRSEEETTATTPPRPPRQEVAVAVATVTLPPLPAVWETSSRPLPVRQEGAEFPPPPPQAPPSFRFSLPRVAGVMPRSTPPLPPAPGIPSTPRFRLPWIHTHLGPLAPPASQGLYRVFSRDPPAASMTSPERKPLIHVRCGSRLRLRCEAVGFPAPRVVWRLPSRRLLGRGVSPDPRVSVATDGSLSVAPVTERDAGDYTCLAGDAHATVTVRVLAGTGTAPPVSVAYGKYHLAAARLTVTPDPLWHAAAASANAAVPVISARVGSSVRMACRGAAGSVAPVTWQLPDGSRVTSFTPVMSSPRVRVDPRGWLTLWPLAPGDAGIYRCWVPDGSVARAMFVHVE